MNYTIKLPAFLFFALASTSGAKFGGQQSATGTVVVIGWSQTKIVIAVDSRGFDDDGKRRDDICKIVRLDAHSVFTAAGNIIHAHDGRALWDAQREASRAFQAAQESATPRPLKTAAKDWGARMVADINQSLKLDPSGSLLMLEDNIFLTGVFIGFENGSTAMYQVEIVFDPAIRQARQNFYIERHHRTIQFAALGRNEIVTEVGGRKNSFRKGRGAEVARLRNKYPHRGPRCPLGNPPGPTHHGIPSPQSRRRRPHRRPRNHPQRHPLGPAQTSLPAIAATPATSLRVLLEIRCRTDGPKAGEMASADLRAVRPQP